MDEIPILLDPSPVRVYSRRTVITSPDALACIGSLMAARLDFLVMSRRTFPLGSGIATSVVNSYRLLFVHTGVVNYTLEDWTGKVPRDGLLLVPAWMKRGWRASKRGPVDLSWVEFNPAAEAAIPSQPFYWKSDAPAYDAAAFSTMLAVWKKKPLPAGADLLIEGALKSLLGRMAAGCAIQSPSPGPVKGGKRSPAITQEIAAVTGWIERHHARPDVMDVAMGHVRSSDHYFRTRFREKTGFTLGQYTMMVRMRRSRYLLSTTAAPVKDVAWQAGFRDPLHFSRCYRKFWGVCPRADRR